MLKNPDKQIVIKGEVKNIPAKKLYLSNAYYWKVFLDSTDYKNDTFSFQINPAGFEPFAANISYIDSDGKIKGLFYNNYLLSGKGKNYGMEAFFLDRGVTTISGTWDPVKNLNISRGIQNDAFYKTQLSDFGWINTDEKTEREKIINSYRALIKQYPNSYYFIFMLENYRTLYSKEELTGMLNLFDEEIKTSVNGKKVLAYLKEMPSADRPLPNYSLKNASNNYSKIIDSSSDLNMIIFWASWCGPCRKEIPLLKEINLKYRNRGLNMVSISIDDQYEMWQKALSQEKMQWAQLVVDSSLSEEVHNTFRFSVIPLTIFTDKRGFELKRFSGYEAGEDTVYTSFIEGHLK